MKQRTVRITDSTGVVELHVAGASSTTLVFPLDIVPSKVLLVDTQERFFEPQANGIALVLIPKADIKAGDTVTLQVGLADGTLLPFILTSVPSEVDLKVDFELALTKKTTPESVSGLKTSIAELQGRLDECQSSSADTAASKVASLVLRQDVDKPVAFQVERHPARHLDRQAKLLVETLHVYRLFDSSYLVLTVENRDPSRAWVMERAEISATGNGSSTDAKVLATVQELASIPTGETSRLVVVYATPLQSAGQRFTLKLFEKSGSRHVQMNDLSL